MVQPTETKILVIGGTPIQAPTLPQVTDTPVSPITSEDCPGITLHPPVIDGNYIKWLVDNGGEETVEILDLQLGPWPAGNGPLEEVHFDDTLIWEGEHEEGEVLRLLEGVELKVEPESPAILAFKFAWAPGIKGYRMRIAFDAGCRIEGAW